MAPEFRLERQPYLVSFSGYIDRCKVFVVEQHRWRGRKRCLGGLRVIELATDGV